MLNLSNLNSLRNLERGSGGKGFLAKNLIFSAPLTSSLFVSGKGSATPTFTRATTATYKDNDGIVRDVLSGESRFTGARRIRNQVTFSQDFTNGIWAKANLTASTYTGFPDPFGGTTSARLIVDNGTSVINNDGLGGISQTVTKTESVAQVIMFSVYAKAGASQVLRIRESTSSGFRAVFDLVTGAVSYENSGTELNFNAQMQSVGNGWWRCSVRFVTGTGATQQFNIKGCGAGTSTTGDGVSDLYIAFVQLEDQTAKVIQAPNEYVSTNVLSSPFHGAMVDGVRYSDSEIQITQNLCRSSVDLITGWTQEQVVTTLSGDFTPLGEPAYQVADNAVNFAHRHTFSTGVAITGRFYTAVVYVKAGTKDTVTVRLSDGPFTHGGRMQVTSIASRSYTEVITGTATMTSSMTDEGSGWRKMTINVTFPEIPAIPLYLLIYTGSDTVTYVGTGQTILIGSVHIRQNDPSVSSTYLPTTGRALQTVTGSYKLPPTTALGFLSELAVTNLVLRSEEFDNASWAKVDTTVTANNIASPDGYTTAELMTEGVAGTAGTNQNSGAYTANSLVTFSVFLKRGNTDWIRVMQNGVVTTADSVRAWFNLATGAKGAVTVAGAATQGASTIESFGNGWYRCSVTYLPNATETQSNGQFMSASADNNTNRVNNATYYAWGAQLEVAGGATSYIPTIASTVTKNTDLLSYPATGNTDPLVGTTYAEVTPKVLTVGSSGRILAYLGAGAGSPMVIGSTGFFQSADGTNFPSVTPAVVVDTTYKIAMCYGNVTQSLARGNPSSGSTLDTAFDGGMGTAPLTSVNIGNIATNQPNANIRNVKIYRVKVSNTTLLTLVA